MKIEFDDKVGDYHKLQTCGFFVKTKIDDRIVHDEIWRINRMPLHLGAFL